MNLKWLVVSVIMMLVPETVQAQITGTVIDARTGQPLDYVNVYYDKKGVGGITDGKGKFSIKENEDWKEITVSSLGYISQIIKLKPGKKKNIRIRLVPSPQQIKDIVITASKNKYSRKNNPSVEFMKKVIAHKKANDLKNKDYYTFTSYEKMVCSVNNVTDKVLESDKLKSFDFVKDQVELCPETGKWILPLTMHEKVTDYYYRNHPKSNKAIVRADKKQGLTTLFQTGDIFNNAVEDVFTEVNIYENVCRLFQYPFTSPIADNAISFYRYYIQDTTYIDNDRVIQVGFIANNQQDFGFTGHLYVMDDSTYQVRRVHLRIPGRSDVNFVESMNISQDFATLPTGDRVMTVNDMLVELKLIDLIPPGALIQRTVRNSDYSFDSIPDITLKKIKGATYIDPNASLKDEKYWAEVRGTTELSNTEKNLGKFVTNLKKVKGFKPAIFVFKTLMENFIETGDSTHNYVDIGPVNTAISYNHYDGLRLRVSAITNANLSPHLFGKGYVAYGTQTKNVYGKGELIYSFKNNAYLPDEFPKHDISLSYMNDVVSPFDQFLKTDKDNMFLAVKSGKNDQFTHVHKWRVNYQREYESGFGYSASLTRTHTKPVDELFYQQLNGTPVPENDPVKWLKNMNTTELTASVTFEPGAVYSNTKQRRIKMNKDAPIITLSHTLGIDGLLGSDYHYNISELNIYKRIWMPHAWGKIDLNFRAGAQWNKVPYPMLLLPPANQSYIIQQNTFEMINALEFMNDRYALMFFDWHLNGKIFNRIPLLQRLKWREFVGFNIMMASLTDKNNPATSDYTDKDLFYFPGHFKEDGTYECNTYRMDWDRPYMELRFGIANIFKLFHVEAVRRLSYLDNDKAKKWGFRLMIKMQF